MNSLVRVVVVAALLAAGAAAHASSFDFSYTFGDGQDVIGQFTGATANGGQSVNISNIEVQLDGIPFAPVVVGGLTYGNATLQADTWDPSTDSFSDTIPVTVYANGALNNFAFSDVDVATDGSPDYFFYYLNDSTNGDSQEAVAGNELQSGEAEGNPTQLAIAPGNAANWTLTQVQSPPDGADGPIPLWALVALGAGLLGIASRRLALRAV